VNFIGFPFYSSYLYLTPNESDLQIREEGISQVSKNMIE
jgi:hypothetical protein